MALTPDAWLIPAAQLAAGEVSVRAAEPPQDAALDADADEASRLRIQGAPTFFVNGQRIIGAQPLEVFREAIDKALAAGPRPSR